MKEEEKEKVVEIPEIWDAKINKVAKQWLKSKNPGEICPREKYKEYLSDDKYFRWFCADICHELFLKARMHRTCPCKILKLEEVKDRVKKVIEQWEKEDMSTFRKKLFRAVKF